MMLFSININSPIGLMIAVADERALWLLEFADAKGFQREMLRLTSTHGAIHPGTTPPLQSIQQELNDYFAGRLRQFKTPLAFMGTPFQQKVWESLRQIPHGETRSYAELAQTLGHSKAYRAVANANAANQLAIIVPCHRVIQANGVLGGYDGGIARKTWLLSHEQ